MSELLNEKLSHLMDSEYEGDEDRALDDLVRDPSGQRTWWRYHLISDVLRHESITLVHPDLTARISAAVKSEPTILAPMPLNSRRWVKPVAGFAIAASVAVVAIVSFQQREEGIKGQVPQVSQTVAQQTQEPPAIRQFNVPARLASMETLEQGAFPETVNSNLNSYLLNYNEYRTNETRIQGMFPYVRIIAHEDDN